MAEKNGYDEKLVKIGKLLMDKRKALGKRYGGREHFIEARSMELFDGLPWISCRHLASIESGKNWISIEMLVSHAYALEMDPVALFEEILDAYHQ